MTNRQRQRRYLLWRGSLPALAIFTVLMLLSAFADRITQ